MTDDLKPTAPMNSDGLHPDAPRQNSPLKWMALMMVVLIILTITTMWGKEKISIKASPKMPEFSAQAQHGRDVVNAKCSECHGVDGTGGSRKGPPILHSQYRREIFPDYQFKRAMFEGKREKNWRFGAMPPVEGITEADADAVVAYIREVQDFNGIE